MGFFGTLQKLVNSATGSNYRDIFFERYRGPEYTCKGCSKPINRNKAPSDPNSVQIDHIVPQKAGGTNLITNLQPLCPECNRKKSAKINELSLEYSGAALLRELRRFINY